MTTLRFGYDRLIENRIVPNGLRAGMGAFDRWKNQEAEYASGFCAEPLIQLFERAGVSCQRDLVHNYNQVNKKFFYLVEILGSNPTWLIEKSFKDFSPWPGITEQTIDLLREGKALLLITHLKKQSDSSRGDPVKYDIFNRLHQALDFFKIPPSSVVYIGVSPELPEIYNRQLNSSNWPSALKSVLSFNYFEKGWQTYFSKYTAENEIFDLAQSKSCQQQTRKHKYICFNREPRAHRKINLMWLKEKGLLADGLVSFLPKEDALRFDREKSLPDDPLFANLNLAYTNFSSHLPLLVDADENIHLSFCRRWPFAETYFSILTERVFNCDSGWTLLTPKVFKAMTNLHPFLVIGQKDYLKAIRAEGYKTFSGFIDESYDEITDPVERTKSVWSEIERLCKMSKQELHNWYYELFPILEHNWNHFGARCKHSQFDLLLIQLKNYLSETQRNAN